MSKFLAFKWTISRGKNTLGFNICSLWVDGKKVSSCSGGNYDLEGTVLGEYLEKEFQDRLMAIHTQAHSCMILKAGPNERMARIFDQPKGLYGMTTYYSEEMQPKRVSLDGACGESSMITVGEAIGLRFQWMPNGKRKTEFKQLSMDDLRNGNV